jgi:hypothetical protein
MLYISELALLFTRHPRILLLPFSLSLLTLIASDPFPSLPFPSLLPTSNGAVYKSGIKLALDYCLASLCTFLCGNLIEERRPDEDRREGKKKKVAAAAGAAGEGEAGKDAEEEEEVLDGVIMKGLSTQGGRFVVYDVYGEQFEVTAKYRPPIEPLGRGAYAIVWYVCLRLSLSLYSIFYCFLSTPDANIHVGQRFQGWIRNPTTLH